MVGLKSNKDPYQIQMAVDKLVEVCVALLIYLSPKKKKKKKRHYSFIILFKYL
jgi:hypothetical protein